jgi:hypothetical protein
MSELQMMVFGAKRGRRPRAGVRSTQRIQSFVTAEERQELKRVAVESGKPEAEIIREAVNEFVSDYGEKRVFNQPSRKHR